MFNEIPKKNVKCMTEVKKFVWVIPIIAGIVAIVSLLTPVASLNYMGMLTANLWMWDLYIHDFSAVLGPSGTGFITEPMVMIPSLIATGLIVIGGVGSLVSGAILKNNDDIRKGIIPSALMGILFIVGELLWIILVPLNFPMETYFGTIPPGMGTLTFWNISVMGLSMNLHTVGFGFIGGILAAILAFGAAGAASYYSKERKEKIPKKEEISPPTEETSPPEKTEFEFCPECGAKIEDSEIKFCGKCGFEFKTPELSPL